MLVLYLYLDYKEEKKQTQVNLIGSLVKQLIQHEGSAFRLNEVKKMFDASKKETKPKVEEMLHVLREGFKSYSRVFLVIDGLDDTLIGRDLRNRVYELSKGVNNVSIMITARFAERDSMTNSIACVGDRCGATGLSIYFHCETCSRHGTSFDLCQKCVDQQMSCGHPGHKLDEPYDYVHILVKATNPEIQRYVEWEMEKELKAEVPRRIDMRLGGTSYSKAPLTRRLEHKPSLKQQIPEEVAKKSNGMYLLARLYIDSLKTMSTVKQIEDTLMALPEDLDTVYEEKLQRIRKQRPLRIAKLAMRILYWVVCAERPLSLKELQHALSVEPGNTTYDPDEETDEADVVSNTAGLVTVDYNKIVRIHVTLHDYLEKHLGDLFPTAPFDISQTLLTYLNFDDFSYPCQNGSEDLMRERLDDLPLLSYASQYWGHHVPDVCFEPEIQLVLLEFLSSAGKVASCIQAAYFVDSDIDVRKGLNGLHLSAMYGLDSVISDLVQQRGIPIDSVDPKYEQTSLMYACRGGYVTTVMKLLSLGASVNIRSAREITAFREACLGQSNEHKEIARALLQRPELDVNAVYIDQSNRTVLMMATARGDYNTVNLLLSQRPDVDYNLQDQDGNTALSLAISSSPAYTVDIVKLLLSQPNININLLNNVSHSCLIIAARRGLTNVVNQLLDKGADASVCDEGGGTALQRAVDAGRTKLIQIFLSHNVNIHTKDHHERSLLHSASINGQEEAVRLLVDAGLSLNAQGNRGETPLHDASRGDRREAHYAVSKTLLELGADRTIKDKSGRTPAMVAWCHGHIEVLQLLEGNASITATPSSNSLPHPEELPTWSLVKLGYIQLLRQRASQSAKCFTDRSTQSDPERPRLG